MHLNKKGHTAIFRGVTRNKVDHTMMGKTKTMFGDDPPPPNHYKPRYEYV